MKSWLAKFRISSALNEGAPLPKSLRRAIAADPELERFTRCSEALGRALRKPPLAEPLMHDSIMRAVRASVRSENARTTSAFPWRVTASATCAAVVMFCFWSARHRPAQTARQSLGGAAMVLEMSEQMPASMPSFVMAPLSNEWARVDRKLQDTTQVLLASFP